MSADKDNNSSALVFYHGCLVFRLFCSFYNVSGISSPKIKLLCWKQVLFQQKIFLKCVINSKSAWRQLLC